MPPITPPSASTPSRPAFLMLLVLLVSAGCMDPIPERRGDPAALGDGGEDAAASFLVTGALVADGTGAPLRAAHVRVTDGRITEVADPEILTPLPGERVFSAPGRVLAPGFIDTHSHHDRGLGADPSAREAVSQGITTIVAGQDGGSPLPLSEFFAALEAAPVALNVAMYAGHNSIRGAVMEDDYRRAATPGEVEAMRALLTREMEAGALGLSTGLEYDPGIYSDTGEVLALAREAAAHGGRYMSHMRSEDRAFGAALEELLTIGREAGIPVHVSHMKLAMKRLWGTAEQVLARMDAARAEGIRVTADLYPYPYWQSSMTVLLPERDFTDRAAFAFALEELVPPEGFLVAAFGPDSSYVGLRLDSIARLRKTDAVTAYMQLVQEAEAWEGEGRAEGMIGTSMAEEDMEAILRWPHTNIASDGGLADRHPRGAGSYPRVLGRYVRERGVLELPEAIHRMTGLAARNAGIPGRGRIAPGMPGDLVLLDPGTVVDRATPEDPTALSEGILRVWVNGVEVWDGRDVTGAHPGRVIRRGS